MKIVFLLMLFSFTVHANILTKSLQALNSGKEVLVFFNQSLNLEKEQR